MTIPPAPRTERQGPLERLDARAKLLGAVGAVLVCVSTPPDRFPAFAGYFAIAAILLALARLPRRFVLARVGVAAPFVLAVGAFAPFLLPDPAGVSYDLGIGGLAVSRRGLLVLWNAAAKALFAVLMLSLLSGTTPFPQLLHGLSRLGVPEPLVMLLAFTQRYLAVLARELRRMRIAQVARGYRGRWLWHAGATGHLVAAFFLRSYARAERIYIAMASRGYEGRYLHLDRAPLRGAQAAWLGMFLAALVAVRVALPS